MNSPLDLKKMSRTAALSGHKGQIIIFKVFLARTVGCEMDVRRSIHIVSGNGNGKMLWVARALLLLKMSSQKAIEHLGHAFIQFMERTKPLDEASNVPGCMCVRRIADSEVNHNLEIMVESKVAKRVRVEELFGVESFDSIKGTVIVVRSNSGLEPFQIVCTGFTRCSMVKGLRNPVSKLQTGRGI